MTEPKFQAEVLLDLLEGESEKPGSPPPKPVRDRLRALRTDPNREHVALALGVISNVIRLARDGSPISKRVLGKLWDTICEADAVMASPDEAVGLRRRELVAAIQEGADAVRLCLAAWADMAIPEDTDPQDLEELGAKCDAAVREHVPKLGQPSAKSKQPQSAEHIAALICRQLNLFGDRARTMRQSRDLNARATGKK